MYCWSQNGGRCWVGQFSFIVTMQNPIRLTSELDGSISLRKSGFNRCELQKRKVVLAIDERAACESQIFKGCRRIARIGRRYLDGLLYRIKYCLNLWGKCTADVECAWRAWNIKRNEFCPSGEVGHDAIGNTENRAVSYGFHGDGVTHAAAWKIGVKKIFECKWLRCSRGFFRLIMPKDRINAEVKNQHYQKTYCPIWPNDDGCHDAN